MKFSIAEKQKIRDISIERGYSPEVIQKIILSQYVFIRSKITALKFEPDLTREEFDKLKTNFNIPCIGKLYASYYVYNRIHEHNKRNKKLKEQGSHGSSESGGGSEE